MLGGAVGAMPPSGNWRLRAWTAVVAFLSVAWAVDAQRTWDDPYKDTSAPALIKTHQINDLDNYVQQFTAVVEEEAKHHEQDWLRLASDIDRVLCELEGRPSPESSKRLDENDVGDSYFEDDPVDEPQATATTTTEFSAESGTESGDEFGDVYETTRPPFSRSWEEYLFERTSHESDVESTVTEGPSIAKQMLEDFARFSHKKTSEASSFSGPDGTKRDKDDTNYVSESAEESTTTMVPKHNELTTKELTTASSSATSGDDVVIPRTTSAPKQMLNGWATTEPRTTRTRKRLVYGWATTEPWTHHSAPSASAPTKAPLKLAARSKPLAGEWGSYGHSSGNHQKTRRTRHSAHRRSDESQEEAPPPHTHRQAASRAAHAKTPASGVHSGPKHSSRHRLPPKWYEN